MLWKFYVSIFFMAECISLNYCLKNLVYNGDFEQQLTLCNGCWYFFIPSNISGWYQPNLEQLEYKIISSFFTYGMELSTDKPITVCQKFNLTLGHKYQLNYTVYNPIIIQKTTTAVKINNQTVSTLFVDLPDSTGTQILYFQANSKINQLCFNQVHPAIILNMENGAILDNISLFEATYYRIGFKCAIEEKQSIIRLLSNQTYTNSSMDIIDQFQLQYYPTASGLSFQSFTYSSSEDGYLQIQIVSNFSFPLNQLKLMSTNNPNINQMIEFNIEIDHQRQYFHILSSSQISILSQSENILVFLTTIITNFFDFIKLVFCSYFILTFISFENLSLFYIFLNIENVPQFVKTAYYKLLEIEFQQKSFMNWLESTFKLNFKPLYLEIQAEKIPELVQDSVDRYFWFGKFGFSSLVYNNNYESYFFLSLLLMKILILKVAAKLISLELKQVFNMKTKFFIIFIIQFITNFPSFVISLVPRLLTSNKSYEQLLQKVVQILILFSCFASIGLYSIDTKVKKKNMTVNTGKIVNQNKRQNIIAQNLQQVSHHQQSIQKPNLINNKTLIKRNKRDRRHYNSMPDVLILLTIPLLISLKDAKIFLICHSILIPFKLIYCIQKYNNKVSKLINILINVVWVVHHAVFIIFYIISCFTQNVVTYYYYSTAIVILGLISVLTLLIGYLLQLLKFSITLCKILLTITKKLCKLLSKKCIKHIQPTVEPQKMKGQKEADKNKKQKNKKENMKQAEQNKVINQKKNICFIWNKDNIKKQNNILKVNFLKNQNNIKH